MKNILRGLCAVAFVCILLVPGVGDKAWGAFVKKSQADDVAMSWILKDSNPMKNGMGYKVREVLVYSGGAHGNPGYYVALMEPVGWMIIPADDTFEPILAFGNDPMTREAYEQSPLFRSVRVDAPTSNQKVTATSNAIGVEDIPETKRLEREARWGYLSIVAVGFGHISKAFRDAGFRDDFFEKDSLADIVVSPILDGNQWEQNTLKQYGENGFTKKEIPFYDIHTVWGGRRYLVGCTALCAGKLLHHFRFGQPDTGTVVEIEVDGQPLEATPMGGTGTDGAYRWDIMVTSPDYDVWEPLLTKQDPKALAVRDEIARLLYDCGILLGSRYMWNNTKNRPLVTGAPDYALDFMLTKLGYRVDSFLYSHLPAIHISGNDDPFEALAKTNLNFGMPFVVIGAINTGSSSDSDDNTGHAFIVDGYGNDSYLTVNPEGGRKIAYYHAKWDLNHAKFFWNMRNFWFDLSKDSVKLLFGSLRNVALVANVAPNHQLPPLSELVGGRLWFGATPFLVLKSASRSNLYICRRHDLAVGGHSAEVTGGGP